MTNPVAEAAMAVDENPDALDSPEPVEGDAGDRGRARSEKSDPDPDLPDPSEQEPTDPFARLAEPLQGSVKQDHVGELWNPEQGGLNRLVLVLEETFGIGEGLPRIAHGGIALAEMAAKPPESLSDLTSDGNEQNTPDEPDESVMDKGDTKEVMNV